MKSALAEVLDLNITVLINNVGGAQRPLWLSLANDKAERIQRPIDVDVRFTTEITRLLLPQLIKSSPAVVINVGSLASELACPYGSVLSGAKAYNKAWSRSLNLEMKAEGNDIEIMHVLVGMVATVSIGKCRSSV